MGSLEAFLQVWDERNAATHGKMPLFNPEKVRGLRQSQKAHFAKVFYHLRGHFHDFLWYLGNTASDEESKKVILDNIKEEFGGGQKSHEQLYWDFAESLGVDLTGELVDHETYLSFAKEFNRKHLEWLHSHDWESRVAAFSAYERLDNVDYSDLHKLVKNLGVSEEALLFFDVHRKVKHYDAASEGLQLLGLWNRDQMKVVEAYEFIGNHQNKMWKDLSDEVFEKI